MCQTFEEKNKISVNYCPIKYDDSVNMIVSFVFHGGLNSVIRLI